MQGNCPQIVGRTLGWTAGGKIFPFRSQFPSLMVDCAVPDINKFEVKIAEKFLKCIFNKLTKKTLLDIQNYIVVNVWF